MISKFFINRPIFAMVISIVIVLSGSLAIPMLGVEKTPDITPPTVVVTAKYPGANAQTIAEAVATPLEEQINGVEGMLYMSSLCSDDGSMQLTITFDVGVDVDMATVLVQNRVSMAEPMLPEEVIRYGITTQKQSMNITLVLNLLSPDGKFDETFMSNYINIYLRDTLSRVPGVGNITVFGAKDFSMRIWLDPEKLKARNITAAEVISSIREQNIEAAPGQIAAQPTEKGQNFQYTIRTLGRLSSVDEFNNIIIKTTGDGDLLRIKDVARVELGSELYNWFVQHNGRNSVALGIFQLPGANSLEVAKDIRARMDELSKSFPEGLEYNVAFDPTKFITESIREIVNTLIFTVILVVFSVYIFLQDWRTTLIPAITIPVSLIGTFAVMWAMGISINTISMFGLVLVIGIVVDDAIVVVENTVRIMEEEKLKSKEAALKAMMQITGPVIATTLVLLAVFVPTALMGGVTGRLFSQFAITISTATIFSTINALTLSPALCGIVLRPASQNQGRFFSQFNQLLKAITGNYTTAVERITRKAGIYMIMFLGLVLLTYFGFISIPSGFLPDEDEGFFFVNAELPSGASLERTRQVTDKINNILNQTEGINEYVCIGGFSLLNDNITPNTAGYFIMLKPWAQRTDRKLHVKSIVQQVQMRLFGITDAICFAFAPPPIMGMGMAGGFEVKVQDRQSAGLVQMEQVANSIIFQNSNNPVIARLNSSFRGNVPQLYLDIDRQKVKRLGIKLTDVFNTMSANIGSFYANDFSLFGRTYKVMVQADSAFRAQPEDIGSLEVRNDKGQMVPLRTVLDIKDSIGPSTVYHYNLYPCTTITGQAKPGYSSGQAMAEMERLLNQSLPASMGYEWSGISLQEILAGNKAPILFGLASIFVFLFLAAQYESWFVPITIILSVPLALFGAMAFTKLAGFDNNVYTQIGIVLLIALASKTAILLVEFAKQEHQQGKPLIESALSAAKLRFRPILMTAISTIFGVIPLIAASGAGSAARRCLGTAVFGGMIMATVLGLLMIPVFFVEVQNSADKLGKWRKQHWQKTAGKS